MQFKCQSNRLYMKNAILSIIRQRYSAIADKITATAYNILE